MNKAEYAQRRMQLEEKMRALRHAEYDERSKVRFAYDDACVARKRLITKLNAEIDELYCQSRKEERLFTGKLHDISGHYGELRSEVKLELVELEQEFIKTNETEL